MGPNIYENVLHRNRAASSHTLFIEPFIKFRWGRAFAHFLDKLSWLKQSVMEINDACAGRGLSLSAVNDTGLLRYTKSN